MADTPKRYGLGTEELSMLFWFFGDHCLSFTDNDYQETCRLLVGFGLLCEPKPGWFRSTPFGYRVILAALEAARDRFALAT